jgi:hypothetical protein
METVKCTMCKSEWLLDYREHAFYPGKKTCKTCTNRAAMVRLNKRKDKITEAIDHIVLGFKNDTNDPDHEDQYIYSINNFKYVLYMYHINE